MSILKDGYISIVNIFSKQFYFLASLASFLSLFLMFISDKISILVALLFFCLMLFIFTLSLIYVLLKLVNQKSNDFESKSTFVKYETLDCKNITYEVYKSIQSKKTIQTEYNYSFKWSGNIKPIISSRLQNFIAVNDVEDSSVFNKAILKFKKPVYYNENEVIHFKAELNDTDKKSETCVSNLITQEVDIIHYRIVLKYRSENDYRNAILERKKPNSINNNFEKIEEIGFDNPTKSYEYHLLKPDIGYIYRIVWDR